MKIRQPSPPSPKTLNHINNNYQSFYQNLDQPDNESDISVIEKQLQGIQRLLLQGQYLINNQSKFVIIDQIGQKYNKKLCLTNYRILIDQKIPLSIPYGYIQQLKILQKGIRIVLKTGVYFQFVIQGNKQKLQEYINHCTNLLPFCFYALQKNNISNIYDSYAEIQRMRVDSRLYRVVKNSPTKLCLTYPQYFLIPKKIQISNLQQIKKCRYFSRIPVMSFYNQKTNVGLWRAAKKKQASQQTLKYDKSYIRQIPGTIIVLEIQQNALIKSDLNFLSLVSLKMVFYNLTKQYCLTLKDIQTPKGDFFKAVGKWYQQIDKLISAAYYAIDLIHQGQHVLFQQTYAFDRVSQLLVIAQIIMDPFFRTFDGFSILIEKQFIAYGHPFQDRCGFNKNKDNQASPIFIQLLQCINQLIISHPTCFQYTSAYLAKIGYQIYTTKYKNFIDRGDIKKQMKFHKCSKSIWNEKERLKSYYNYQYNKYNTNKQLWEIRKKPSIKQYIIWVQYFDVICKMNGDQPIKGQSLKNVKSLLEKFGKNKNNR